LLRVGRSVKDGVLGEAVGRIAASVERGKSVGEAFGAEKQAFPGEYIALIQAGLAGGNLGVVLRLHASASGRLAQGRQRLLSAAGYPFLVLGALAVFCFLMGFVTVPEMRDCLASIEGGGVSPIYYLSWSIQLFYLLIGSAAVVGVGLFLMVFLRTASRQSALAKVLRMIPGGSYLMDLWSSAATLRSLASYIRVGIALPQGLELCAAPQLLLANRVSLEKAADDLKRGLAPAVAGKIQFLPPAFPHLLGNAGPDLERELNLAADAADADFDDFNAAHQSTLQMLLLGAVGLLTAVALGAFVMLYAQMVGWPVR
jgi:type II secretory pathway component PulF